MLDPAESQRLARILAQHARASLSMGVDCLPIGAGAAMPLEQPRASLTHSAPAAVAVAVAPAAVVEAAKPKVSPVPVPAPPPPPTRPVAALPVVAAIVEPKGDARRPLASKPTTPERSPSAGVDESRDEAQELLDELRRRYEADAPHAAFNTDFTNIVFGEGDPRARLMFVGEAPGADEDRTGRPFVGKAGQLLDKMVLGLGLAREQVYIANVLKTRPPNNATPTSDECAACAPYLYEQIAIVRPEVIVTLGLPATRTLLNTMEAMGKLRGVWAEFKTPALPGLPSRAVPVMPTYHPAFLLRAYTTENRQKVWSDLLKAAERLGLAVPKKAAGDGARAAE
ncbi:MAG: uracil-DNA glycosylase [Phycisphaerales bacterium]|nr:uracil-DNA glycosylase [Phycisphaerales bacterium]